MLSLALTVAFLTQALMAIAAKIDVKVKGNGAVVVSAVVAALATGLAYLAGWLAVPDLPYPDGYADPFNRATAWLVTAGGVLALANLLYVAVYGRVFRSLGTPSPDRA